MGLNNVALKDTN